MKYLYFFLSSIFFLEPAISTANQNSSVPMYVRCDFFEKDPCLLNEQEAQRVSLEIEEGIKDGIAYAHYIKGILLLEGFYNNGSKNSREATIQFSKSAALGFRDAYTCLADSFLHGDGAQKDEKTAFNYYTIAANLGHGTAQFNLAVLYRDGIGVKASKKKAQKYFKLAANNDSLGELRKKAQQLLEQIHDSLSSK
ncbi:MAG: hypothetical protein C0432_03240 [Candidatus Puniceispirillum sp.]|nr:hypothetical protein [Candidatus Pelagibacter sp.]MBA4283289.1 hypothetical protein [Candidatus Puniceispirillum sp.]